MSNTLNPPPKQQHDFKRVAILFAGGPAPAANAVISAAAASFLKAGVEVVGIKNGYSNLIDFCPDSGLHESEQYINLSHKFLSRSRNKQGILIGTARANPGKQIHSPADLQNPEKALPLQKTYHALRSIGVDALISIGGDDTLKTANKFKLFQETLPEDEKRIPVVHLPKTIDNDYHGIDFTFGYFTAVEFLGSEIRNLIHDAEACNAYFVAETMGRSAGWLAYGAAIAGEASLVISVEDIIGDYLTEETYNDTAGNAVSRNVMDIQRVVGRIVKQMLAREEEGKEFGVIVLAEGLAELLPFELIKDAPRDDHGHISISDVNLCEVFTKAIETEFQAATGRSRKVKGLQLGYESRCAKPHAFDVMLGSQLGVGAYRALVEEQLDGVMVTVSGQLDLHYEPFENLVDPETLVTRVRHIEPGSDFHFLARFLETHVNE
ncbi:MAG: 6-phosphofructokinase [Planctomycetaceae bacterium]|nr:6-phosphofructokinase [Planctomycetaceae bacterium]MCP4461701.1 6-phosphofructokinase [Planctomycetaceae bacterium]MDG1809674.1 6-phosphofructokinase [Pirellulaceae bacterium]MDG2103116.1 6-phosphofructokinase [Pirellulaceae bacterium]